MVKCLKVFLILILCALLFSNCVFAQGQTPKKNESMTFAPEFTLQDTKGGSVTLSDYRGKQPVILFFWTTWCPYCREELKTLSKMYPELVKEGWEVFAIDLQEPSIKVQQVVERFNLKFRVLLDKDASVAQSYDILGVPTYFFINKKGNIVLTEHNFPENKYKELK